MDTKTIDQYKNKKKDWSIRSLFRVMTYTRDGLIYFFKYERSSIIYLASALLAIGSGIIIQMSLMEWVVIIFVLLVILATELINTAIEAVCDLVSPEQHPLVKVAKDCGSAASGVLTVLGFVVVAVIYTPRVIIWIQRIF